MDSSSSTSGIPVLPDFNPVVMESTGVIRPPNVLTGADVRTMVPGDPEEFDGEDLTPKELVSTTVIPGVVAYTGELGRSLNLAVLRFTRHRLEMKVEFPTFFPHTLGEARSNAECPPLPTDSELGNWMQRIMSIQSHVEFQPRAFRFYNDYGVTAENNLIAFQCVQLITQDHILHGDKGLSGKLPKSLYSTSYHLGGDIAKDIAAIARVHPAAMGLVAYYYRLELSILAFRRVMARYEGTKVEADPVTYRQF